MIGEKAGFRIIKGLFFENYLFKSQDEDRKLIFMIPAVILPEFGRE
jgi:hypothetical protein